ncbi:hypothetical protein LTR37_011809 [Vermiconidia calcicola]|uniref:Uncharacterized protein n=1 Tax=Vermiconidia calcicola TaxID=1690605 RepID=A0ACC3N1N3_9PEZI|nr:hypothetical protein LTR37_011809 [Vermiconidia calcicola]
MVSFTSAALLSLATIGTFAAPALEKRTGLWNSDSKCLNKASAQQVADNYAELIRAYTDELAEATLTEDFVDYSESVNSLINTCPQGSAAVTLPLLQPTFSSLDEFKEGQGQQAPINFEQLDIRHSCDSVTIRWKTTNTVTTIEKVRPVVGIIVLLVEKAPAGGEYPWLINTVYSEFDAAAWLQNLQEAGICTATLAGSPQLPIPASSVPAAASSAVAASSSYAAPASGSAAPSSYVAPSASSYAAPSASSYAAPSASSYSAPAASSSCSESAAASSSWVAQPTTTWVASSASAAPGAYSTGS